MDRGNLFVETIEIPKRFAGRLLQDSILCPMATVIFLFTNVLFELIFPISCQKLDFLSFVYYLRVAETLP